VIPLQGQILGHGKEHSAGVKIKFLARGFRAKRKVLATLTGAQPSRLQVRDDEG
jgi:hypothetical protein